MNQVEALFQLQMIDHDIDSRCKRISDLEPCIGNRDSLVDAEEERDQACAAWKMAQSRLQDLEFEANRLSTKLTEVNEKLFSGRERSARELSNLQKEADMLTAGKSRTEDAQLEAMGAVEEAHQTQQRTDESFQMRLAEWQDGQDTLQRLVAEYQEELKELQEARLRQLQLVDPASLRTYETLRRQKQGRAVAKVEQGVCTACRVSMGPSHVQRARSGKTLVNCPSCGRILYVGR